VEHARRLKAVLALNRKGIRGSGRKETRFRVLLKEELHSTTRGKRESPNRKANVGGKIDVEALEKKEAKRRTQREDPAEIFVSRGKKCEKQRKGPDSRHLST